LTLIPIVLEDNKEKLKKLLKQANWTPEDRNWLLTFLDSEDVILLRELLREEFFAELQSVGTHEDARSREILERIHQRIGFYRSRPTADRRFLFKRMAVAASILLLLSSVIVLYRAVQPDTVLSVKPSGEKPIIHDLAPGGDKAVLTLSDGSVVILDDAMKGRITEQEKVSIEKPNEGELRYQPTEESDALVFNSISTPRGGKYAVTLSDGSRVWLNAASSLTFPIHFIGRERRVELTGEAYFEIARDEARPFLVNVAGKEEVRVLGTHFNINSYADETSIQTTLIEGSVMIQVNGSNDRKLLLPGQQFRLYPTGKSSTIGDVNMEEVVAWKEGKFSFGESMDLEQAMRQVCRWYDVEVRYEGDVSGISMGGSISRNVKASKVFEMLEMTGVATFRIEGRRVIVKAKRKKE